MTRIELSNTGPTVVAFIVVLIYVSAAMGSAGLERVFEPIIGKAIFDAILIIFAITFAIYSRVPIFKLADWRPPPTIFDLSVPVSLLIIVISSDLALVFIENSEKPIKFGICTPAAASAYGFLRSMILSPIVEEMLFTGALFTACWRRLNAIQSMMIVAGIFCLVHFPGNFNQVLFRVIFMVASCVLFMRYRVLWPSMCFHATVNTILIIIDQMESLCNLAFSFRLHFTGVGFIVVAVSGLAILAMTGYRSLSRSLDPDE